MIHSRIFGVTVELVGSRAFGVTVEPAGISGAFGVTVEPADISGTLEMAVWLTGANRQNIRIIAQGIHSSAGKHREVQL